MRNALLLLLAAGVLFAVSAGLSLYLNQPKRTEEAVAAPKPAAKKQANAADHGPEREHAPAGAGAGASPMPKSIMPAMPANDPIELARLSSQLQMDAARVALREAEHEQQRESYRIVLDDLRDEMVIVQRLYQQRAAGLKPNVSRSPDVPKAGAVAPPPMMPAGNPPEPGPKKPPVAEGPDPRNVSRVTGISESMPADAAARVIEQMAKSGKMDLAVQLLARMNPRHAAKVLAAVGDEKLSVEIIERLLEARTPPKPAGPP